MDQVESNTQPSPADGNASQAEIERERKFLEVAAATYAQAVFLAGGRAPSRYAIPRLVSKYSKHLRKVMELCAQIEAPLHEYVELQCKYLGAARCSPTRLYNDVAKERWLRTKGQMYEHHLALQKPTEDAYDTGRRTLHDAHQRLAWLRLDPELVLEMTSPTLPVEYLVESPTARRLAAENRLQPLALNARVRAAAAKRGDTSLRGDGL